ncbi:MAG: hypothetical protein P1P84_20340 [Deferrisomatales bacterium]|nr:hypothetical protein [Deferrisomatales bacterium]
MQNGIAGGLDTVPELCDECPCPKTGCERYLKCRECHDYHAHRSPQNELPFCLRDLGRPMP